MWISAQAKEKQRESRRDRSRPLRKQVCNRKAAREAK
jgi:hypothetical protein